MSDYTVFLDLAKEVQPPDKGILSRTLYSDDRLKAVLFGFAQGEDRPGTWSHMPTGLRHSIQAKTPVVMLLLLLKESPP
jgi:hypothetical protein